MGSPLGLEGTSKIYSYLSVFMGSASASSNSDGSKIFEKKYVALVLTGTM